MQSKTEEKKDEKKEVALSELWAQSSQGASWVCGLVFRRNLCEPEQDFQVAAVCSNSESLCKVSLASVGPAMCSLPARGRHLEIVHDVPDGGEVLLRKDPERTRGCRLLHASQLQACLHRPKNLTI